MRKSWKYALVALLAAAMLFSFTACSDDSDDDGLSDKQITNIVGAAVNEAVSGTLSATSDGYYANDYSTWVPTLNGTNIRQLKITISQDYTCYVNGDYDVAASGKYSVVLSQDSVISVDFTVTGYGFTADLNATINGEDANLDIDGLVTGATTTYQINGKDSSYDGIATVIQNLATTINTNVSALQSALNSSST